MRVADFAWVGREFLVRCGSRILRCLVGGKWLRRGIFVGWYGAEYLLVRGLRGELAVCSGAAGTWCAGTV